MASDYEIETPEYLAHGIKVYQYWMLSDSEDKHIEYCSAIAGYRHGNKICDIGCGIGYVAHRMNFAGYESVGVTNSKFQHDYAVEHFPETQFLLCDMTKTPLPGETFDAVQWMESVGYVDQKRAFSEGYRILKVGGKAIVKDFAAIKDASLACESWSYRFVSAGEMIKLAESAGLRLVKAFVLSGDDKRLVKFYSASKLLQTLHPTIVLEEKPSIPFWYEFVKVKEVY
uniref:Putative methyltransferase n=1 Tax=viral metagenome TaxID=1070528 RepID=A0A6M3ISW0_9ZZZZ